jgi:hypothetical protein
VAHGTLMQVAARAVHDEGFFQMLMKNVDEALKSAGYSLPDGDLAN